ncbi:MAG: hypothetical protein KZQ76_03330 [Candidatus Thiodiazotropha sp. (ex Epidulcina cf. delphinae)]|nr:hypothetical protein [Candidatus Thiodiazotropha sp. (ex Epidulcina cf. delphinae)]
MSNRHQNFSPARDFDEGVIPFRTGSVDQLPVMAQDESCQIIKQYFDCLELNLTQQDSRIDIGQLREMLREISHFIRSGKGKIQDDGYIRMLNRLTRIYAKGIHAQDDRAFTGTAVNFADILNTVSQTYTGYDYSESVGLLLHYMNRLFNYREEGWIEVFEHLLSMPDSIHAMRMFKQQHLQEIQNWVEEGVDNLFAIRDEQLGVIKKLNGEIFKLDQEIRQRKRALTPDGPVASAGSVISYAKLRDIRSIDRLRIKRLELLDAREGRLELADLLDDNIQEFGDRLTEIRRSALVQLVWNNLNKV